MARYYGEFNADCPYHITSRCINRDWFGMPQDEVWRIMEDQLYLFSHAFNVEIHAFILMNNHFHMIARAPQSNLSEAMAYLLVQTSRSIIKNVGRINSTWAGRFWRCCLTSNQYYLHAYKYLYRNSVAAGICSKVEDYPFSSLYGLLGRTPLIIPLIDDATLFSGVNETLYWLNEKPTKEHEDAVRLALKRRNFRLQRDARNKKPHSLETATF